MNATGKVRTRSRSTIAIAVLLCSIVGATPGGAVDQQAKLIASDAAATDNFGQAIVVSGDTAVVGAWHDDSPAGVDTGAAYVFTRAGTTWTQQAKLTAADATASDEFGISVAVSDATAVVGARFEDTFSGDNAGAAYVFTRSGTTWSQQAKLTAAGGGSEWFGTSVAISGDTVVIGSRLDNAPIGWDTGSAYVFTRLGSTWTQQAKLTASDAAVADQLGQGVGISGDTVVVGAVADDTTAGVDAGSAYVFTRSGGTWAESAKLTASDAAPYDVLGYSVAVSGDTAVVGALGDDTTAGVDAGSVYVFTRSGTTWTQSSKLVAGDAADGDLLGISVALSGDTALAGAFLDDTAGGTDAGSVYMFHRSGSSWTQRAKLTAADAAPFDNLGLSVALSGETAVAGAWQHDNQAGNDSGSAYVFELDTTPPDTLIDSGPAGTVDSTSAVFAFSATEPSTFTCSLDDAPETPCTSPTAYTDLVEGAHEFSVRATDLEGNADPSPATREWSIDETPPEVAITTADGSILVALRSVLVHQVTGTASDTSGISLVDVTFTPLTPLAAPAVSQAVLTCSGSSCTWSADPAMFVGLYEVRARATDPAGNTADSSPITVLVVGIG